MQVNKCAFYFIYAQITFNRSRYFIFEKTCNSAKLLILLAALFISRRIFKMQQLRN